VLDVVELIVDGERRNDEKMGGGRKEGRNGRRAGRGGEVKREPVNRRGR